MPSLTTTQILERTLSFGKAVPPSHLAGSPSQLHTRLPSPTCQVILNVLLAHRSKTNGLSWYSNMSWNFIIYTVIDQAFLKYSDTRYQLAYCCSYTKLSVFFSPVGLKTLNCFFSGLAPVPLGDLWSLLFFFFFFWENWLYPGGQLWDRSSLHDVTLEN